MEPVDKKIVWRPFGANPLSESIRAHYHRDPSDRILVKIEAKYGNADL